MTTSSELMIISLQIFGSHGLYQLIHTHLACFTHSESVSVLGPLSLFSNFAAECLWAGHGAGNGRMCDEVLGEGGETYVQEGKKD